MRLNTDNNCKTCLNSNTTLVKVKFNATYIKKVSGTDSNTTLVKVKSVCILPKTTYAINSNTTLVKVKYTRGIHGI